MSISGQKHSFSSDSCSSDLQDEVRTVHSSGSSLPAVGTTAKTPNSSVCSSTEELSTARTNKKQPQDLDSNHPPPLHMRLLFTNALSRPNESIALNPQDAVVRIPEEISVNLLLQLFQNLTADDKYTFLDSAEVRRWNELKKQTISRAQKQDIFEIVKLSSKFDLIFNARTKRKMNQVLISTPAFNSSYALPNIMHEKSSLPDAFCSHCSTLLDVNVYPGRLDQAKVDMFIPKILTDNLLTTNLKSTRYNMFTQRQLEMILKLKKALGDLSSFSDRELHELGFLNLAGKPYPCFSDLSLTSWLVEKNPGPWENIDNSLEVLPFYTNHVLYTSPNNEILKRVVYSVCASVLEEEYIDYILEIRSRAGEFIEVISVGTIRVVPIVSETTEAYSIDITHGEYTPYYLHAPFQIVMRAKGIIVADLQYNIAFEWERPRYYLPFTSSMFTLKSRPMYKQTSIDTTKKRLSYKKDLTIYGIEPNPGPNMLTQDDLLNLKDATGPYGYYSLLFAYRLTTGLNPWDSSQQTETPETDPDINISSEDLLDAKKKRRETLDAANKKISNSAAVKKPSSANELVSKPLKSGDAPISKALLDKNVEELNKEKEARRRHYEIRRIQKVVSTGPAGILSYFASDLAFSDGPRISNKIEEKLKKMSTEKLTDMKPDDNFILTDYFTKGSNQKWSVFPETSLDAILFDKYSHKTVPTNLTFRGIRVSSDLTKACIWNYHEQFYIIDVRPITEETSPPTSGEIALELFKAGVELNPGPLFHASMESVWTPSVKLEDIIKKQINRTVKTATYKPYNTSFNGVLPQLAGWTAGLASQLGGGSTRGLFSFPYTTDTGVANTFPQRMPVVSWIPRQVSDGVDDLDDAPFSPSWTRVTKADELFGEYELTLSDAGSSIVGEQRNQFVSVIQTNRPYNNQWGVQQVQALALPDSTTPYKISFESLCFKLLGYWLSICNFDTTILNSGPVLHQNLIDSQSLLTEVFPGYQSGYGDTSNPLVNWVRNEDLGTNAIPPAPYFPDSTARGGRLYVTTDAQVANQLSVANQLLVFPASLANISNRAVGLILSMWLKCFCKYPHQFRFMSNDVHLANGTVANGQSISVYSTVWCEDPIDFVVLIPQQRPTATFVDPNEMASAAYMQPYTFGPIATTENAAFQPLQFSVNGAAVDNDLSSFLYSWCDQETKELWRLLALTLSQSFPIGRDLQTMYELWAAIAPKFPCMVEYSTTGPKAFFQADMVMGACTNARCVSGLIIDVTFPASPNLPITGRLRDTNVSLMNQLTLGAYYINHLEDKLAKNFLSTASYQVGFFWDQQVRACCIAAASLPVHSAYNISCRFYKAPQDVIPADSIGSRTAILEDLINNTYSAIWTKIIDCANEWTVRSFTSDLSGLYPLARGIYMDTNVAPYFVIDLNGFDYQDNYLPQQMTDFWQAYWLEKGPSVFGYWPKMGQATKALQALKADDNSFVLKALETDRICVPAADNNAFAVSYGDDALNRNDALVWNTALFHMKIEHARLDYAPLTQNAWQNATRGANDQRRIGFRNFLTYPSEQTHGNNFQNSGTSVLFMCSKATPFRDSQGQMMQLAFRATVDEANYMMNYLHPTFSELWTLTMIAATTNAYDSRYNLISRSALGLSFEEPMSSIAPLTMNDSDGSAGDPQPTTNAGDLAS